MSNETTTDTEHESAAEQTPTEYGRHPSELNTPLRSDFREVMAHVVVDLTKRTLIIAFAVGVVIGTLTAQWMINSIAISTSGLPEPLFILFCAIIGGVGMLGTEFAATFTAGYVKVKYLGMMVDHPL